MVSSWLSYVFKVVTKTPNISLGAVSIHSYSTVEKPCPFRRHFFLQNTLSVSHSIVTWNSHSITSIKECPLSYRMFRCVLQSGSIMALLGSICTQYPDAQLAIIFLPFFTFSAKSVRRSSSFSSNNI